MYVKPNGASGEGIVTFGAALKDDNESLMAFLKNKQLPRSVSKQMTSVPSEQIFIKNKKKYTSRESPSQLSRLTVGSTYR